MSVLFFWSQNFTLKPKRMQICIPTPVPRQRRELAWNPSRPSASANFLLPAYNKAVFLVCAQTLRKRLFTGCRATELPLESRRQVYAAVFPELKQRLQLPSVLSPFHHTDASSIVVMLVQRKDRLHGIRPLSPIIPRRTKMRYFGSAKQCSNSNLYNTL